MARLTSKIKQFIVQNFKGQNTKMEENENDAMHGTVAQNCRFEGEPGTIYKRSPVRKYNSTALGSNPVKTLYRAYKSDGTAKLFAGYTTTMKIGTDAAGTFANVKTGLTSDKRYTWQVYKDLVIFSNGTDNIQVTDFTGDNVSWELGSCKAKLNGAAGNIDENTTNCDYVVTMSDDAYVCGAVSNIIASITAGGGKIDLSNIPLGPSGTTNRKIYRRNAGTNSTSGAWKLLTTIADNSTTTYTDNTADVTGEAALPAVTDDFPKGAELQIHRERLFITRDPNSPNKIYYSDPYLPWYIRQTVNLDYMLISENDGDEIAGIPIHLGYMVCIKKNSIRKLHITTPVSGYDPSMWYADDPISFSGCCAPWTIKQTPYGIIYLGWDHWYMFDGSKSAPIIDEFDTKDILDSSYSDTVGHWHNGVYMASYTDAAVANQYHDRVMRYNVKRDSLSYDLMYVDSFASAIGDSESGELYLGESRSTSGGFVYKSEITSQWIPMKTKTQANLGTKTDIYVGGTEDDPWFEIGRTDTIDDLAGDIDSLTGTINMPDTDGTYTAPSQQISASTMGKIYWNERFFHGSDTVLVYTRSGADQATCETAAWSAALTDPNGSTITSTADEWFQWKIELTANSTAGSPRIYKQGGFLVKYDYVRGGVVGETAVEFIYDTGFKNFTEPMIDKIYKNLTMIHEGDTGTYTIYWYTDEPENQSGTFTVDLTTHPKRWEAFFPSTAYGRKIRIRIYKNDNEDLKIKEFKGLYSPEPIIV